MRGLDRFIRQLAPRSLVRYRGACESNVVGLSFDDGPCAGLTERALDVLAERGCSATFFVIGRRAEANRCVVARIQQQGCEIGNHTYSHPANFERLPRSKIAAQIANADAVVEAVVGQAPRFFRPPRGAISLRLLWHLRKIHRLPLVLWSKVLGDDETVPGRSREEILSQLESVGVVPGDVLLLHDTNANTIEALPGILDWLAARRLRAAAIRELIA